MLAAERTGSVRLAASCHDLQGASPEKCVKVLRVYGTIPDVCHFSC